MSSKGLEAKLADLKPRSATAVVRSLFPLIEQRLADGVSYSQLVELLRDEGLDISVGTLGQILHRLRRKQDLSHLSRPVPGRVSSADSKPSG